MHTASIATSYWGL